MIPYIETIRSYSDAYVVLRTHNIEHLIWQRLASNAKNILRKWYLNLLAERLQHYEMWALNRVDAIVALTKEDHESMLKLGADIPINISPIGIDIKDYNVVENSGEPVIFHLGAMDWIPNQEGIKWFLENVWPTIKLEYPTVKLKFAGKKMPEEFFKYSDNQCEVNDFVPDGMKYMQDGSIMVVPLFSGSGMRVKIIEGLALGKAIITTTIGLEGIPAENQKEVLVADNAEQFINCIRDLLNHPNRIKELGTNARILAETHFDNPGIGKRLLNFYSELISGNSK
jgi:glycosyltransferase involved in cell wall biosynthesis